MPKRTRVVIGGVDTHGRTHHAAAIDQQGRLLGDREFPADSGGYRQLLGWLRRHGNLDMVGVEGTGSYGAGLTRFLLDRGINVVEVDRPDRRTRRQRGKSDPIDAEAAARAVLAGTATAPAKRRDSRRRVDPDAPGGAQRCHPRPGPQRSTSSKVCWSPRRHRCGRRWRAAPPRRWPPPAPGCAPRRPPWPIQSMPPRRRCASSLAASTSSTRRSVWPINGWPPSSAAPHPGC